MMRLVGLVIYIIVSFVVVAGILFIPAGRTDLPMYWAYLVVMIVLAVIAAAEVFRRNPDLLKEQRQPGKGNQDRLTVPAFYLLFLLHWIVAGLDVGRYHWTDTVPVVLQIVGLIGYGGGLALLAWSTIINRFYSSAVRLQTDRAQELITTGPYHYVRHPGYIGWILFVVFSGIALGSWLSVLPMLLLVIAIIRRTIVEDQMLQSGLEGYQEYARNVRYRLIPGVW